MMKNEQELLREYLRESLLLEYDGYAPGAAGAALRGAFRGAWEKSFGREGGGIEAIKGKGKKFISSIKHLGKGVIEGLKEVLSAGILTADYDKVHKEYLDDIKDIERKYGSAFERVKEKFSESASLTPLFFAGLFINPAVAVGALAAKKGSEKISDKATINSLSAAASKDFQRAINSYFQLLKEEDKKKRDAKSLSDFGLDEDKLSKSIENFGSKKDEILKLLKVEKRRQVLSKVKSEKEKLKSALNKAGIDDTLILDAYDKIIDELKSN